MFVDPTRGRSQGFALVAAAAGAFAFGACNDPEQNTNLRPDGDPEVLAVLVMTDAANHLVESATYCALNDEKRPAIVGLPDFTAPLVCPEDLSKPAAEVDNAYPDGWYVRIMFDELLDPSIEELTEIKDPDTMEGTDTFTGSIANTHPVKLECESLGGGFVEVPYDGYYSPAGNAVTWPLGPSLVIIPNEPKSIATNKACRVTINDNVTDKSGNKVPTAQRGAYNFKIAPIQIVLIDPPDDAKGTSPVPGQTIWFDNFYVQFNTEVDPASVCDEGTGMDECEFTITPEDTGICSSSLVPGAPLNACVRTKAGADCPTVGDTCEDVGYTGYPISETEFGFGPNAPVQSDSMYKFAFKAGTKIADRCGVETTFAAPKVADQTEVNFKTAKFALTSSLPGNGDLVSALRRPELVFNNPIRLASLTVDDYTIDPAPQLTGALFATSTFANARLRGFFKMNTEYTFTLKAGAKVSDAFGVEYTQAEAKVIKFKTQAAITVSTSADKSTFTYADPADVTEELGPILSFNQAMLPATLTEGADYTVTPTQAPGTLSAFVVAGCSMSSTSCQIQVAGHLAPGDYTFTLKAGATIDDALTPPSTYTQAADKVVHFTVKNPTPVTPITCL